MTYRQLFNLFRETLAPIIGQMEANSTFFMALEHYTAFNRTSFYLQENDIAGASVQKNMEMVMQRLKKNEPIQYILGEAWFCEQKFKVDQNVLIPRPETEELVSLIINKKPDAGSVLDLGTGSGCIAVSLQLYLKNDVLGVDISKNAIKIAKENAKELGSNTKFKTIDMLDSKINIAGCFDIIVSNPPYVKHAEKVVMERNVTLFEPGSALYVPDNDPLLFYRAIMNIAASKLDYNGLVAVEINEALGNETAQLFKDFFKNVIIHKDIHGKDRFITAEKWKKRSN